jgi:hypothetical protein
VELLYENVREMTDDRLRGRSGAWTVVLDFPFDDANFGPADDLAAWRSTAAATRKTLVWLPSFLSNKALADLGRLVVLDYILQGERFDNYAAHLSFVDRVQAKALARNQLDQLRIKLRSQLEVAYGISTEPRDAVSNPLTADQQFKSLDPTLSPRPPVGADFKSAFESLLGSCLPTSTRPTRSSTPRSSPASSRRCGLRCRRPSRRLASAGWCRTPRPASWCVPWSTPASWGRWVRPTC